jgi:hypothetical protein
VPGQIWPDIINNSKITYTGESTRVSRGSRVINLVRYYGELFDSHRNDITSTWQTLNDIIGKCCTSMDIDSRILLLSVISFVNISLMLGGIVLLRF